MLIPIRDINPRQRFPLVTLLLVVANALAFLYQLGAAPEVQQALANRAGAIPLEISTLRDLGAVDLVPPPLTIITSMFLHGSFMHIVGNMWFLWLFGDNVEDRLGRVRFLAFYLLTGIVGALAQCFMMPESPVPMIGASGAIAGILGGYVMLFPRARIVTFVPIPFLWPLLPLPAWIFLGLWFVGQFLLGAGSGVAWMAHVGGFLAGLGMVRLLEYMPNRRL